MHTWGGWLGIFRKYIVLEFNRRNLCNNNNNNNKYLMPDRPKLSRDYNVDVVLCVQIGQVVSLVAAFGFGLKSKLVI